MSVHSLGPFWKAEGLPVLNKCYRRACQQSPLRMTCHFVSQLQEEERGSLLTGDDGVTRIPPLGVGSHPRCSIDWIRLWKAGPICSWLGRNPR